MIREILPELLDSLPPDHRDALRSRRDLRLINRFMRNPEWFERTLPPLMKPGERALELGAGMGELGRRLIARGVPVDALDLWPRAAGWPGGRAWHTADLRDFQGYTDYPVIYGNLIFHQFTEPQLAELGARIRQGARVVLACEPERRRLSQVLMSTVAPLFRASHVTLHDARVSITAGFRGDELPRALGLIGSGWTHSIETTALGALRMVAVRT